MAQAGDGPSDPHHARDTYTLSVSHGSHVRVLHATFHILKQSTHPRETRHNMSTFLDDTTTHDKRQTEYGCKDAAHAVPQQTRQAPRVAADLSHRHSLTLPSQLAAHSCAADTDAPVAVSSAARLAISSSCLRCARASVEVLDHQRCAEAHLNLVRHLRRFDGHPLASVKSV